jgi:hypothetical protein
MRWFYRVVSNPFDAKNVNILKSSYLKNIQIKKMNLKNVKHKKIKNIQT